MRDLSLGIDIGTTSTKGVVIDPNGNIVFEHSVQHDLISTQPNFAEEDPNVFLSNTYEILSLIHNAGLDNRIASVGVTGMVPTLIPVDSTLKPLRNSIQQNDARAIEEIEYYKSIINEEEYFKKTGNTINQQVIFPKWLWLKKHEEDVVKNTRWIMGSYDFVSTRLTGKVHVELNWALESGLLNIHTRDFDTEILNAVSIEKSLLPPIVKPTEIIGYTTKEVESITGFESGIPVIGGSADHIASTLAMGLLYDGDLLLKFGGAGDIMYVSDTLKVDRRLFIDFHDIENKYVLNGCMAASGSLVKWFMRNVVNENSFDKLTEEAYKSEIGARGIITLPYFLGEKTPIFDTKARGVLFGLQLHHTRGDIFRSILESIVYGFLHHVDVLNDLGLEIKRVFISEGGARNPLTREIAADSLGKELKYIKSNPGSSLGVAFLAGVSSNIFKDYSEIEKFLKDFEIIKPNKEKTPIYKEYFALYKDLYKTLKPLFERLYEVQTKYNKGG
jgi:xylulokinase